MSTTLTFDIIARDRASGTFDKFGRSVDNTGSKVSKLGGGMKSFAKSALGHMGALAGVAGIGGLIVSSSKLEQQYSKTMALVGAATGAPQGAMRKLDALAMKMGADTAFSANEAADAMLELGKAGISTKNIMGGALKGTLLLATAGSVDLGTAATIASNAMNTFSLKGTEMKKVAAALAGGANASSASVESLGQGLQQVGPGAKNAGLSLQETVATLSAFDAAGIKGSDAGTSLKTMLSRLIPTTEKASDAIGHAGLNFVKANGEFQSITNIAEQLQKKLGPLSEAQRAQTLQTIFGSDATRAATVLMNEGAEGLGKYIKATNDRSAAEDMAKAAMSGTSGAMEKLRGAVETAQLAIGKGLAPAVAGLADWLSGKALPAITGFIDGMRDGSGAGGKLGAIIGELGGWFRNELMPPLRDFAEKAAPKARDIMTALMGAFEDSRPFIELVGKIITNVVVPGMKKLLEVAGPVLVNQIKTMGKALEFIGEAGKWMWNNALQPVFKFLADGIAVVLDGFSSMLDAMSNVPGFGWAKKAADAMGEAAEKARAVADSIKKIPNKTVTVTVAYKYTGRKNGVGSTRSNDPNDPSSYLPKVNRVTMESAAASFMETIAEGIRKGGKKLDEVLKTSRDRIQQKLSGIRDEMRGMSDSIASALNNVDFGGTLQEHLASLTSTNGALSNLMAVFQNLKDGASKGYLSSLMQSGNIGLATALANDPAALAQASSLFDANAAMSKGLGDQTAQTVLGDRFEKALADEIGKLVKELKDSPGKTARELRKEIKDLRLVVEGLSAGQKAHLRGAFG